MPDGKTIKAEHFGIETANSNIVSSKNMTLDEMEKKIIAECLEKNQNNISSCAKILGISRPTLYRKLEKYNIPYSKNS